MAQAGAGLWLNPIFMDGVASSSSVMVQMRTGNKRFAADGKPRDPGGDLNFVALNPGFCVVLGVYPAARHICAAA
jgi:NADH:ubiquinone oxidoreductase subunit F (NADH-binding)